jgi:hypothetical protein
MKKILILMIVLIGCTQNHPNNSKSRIELVKDTPYRILNVPQNVKDQLLAKGHLIWEMVDSMDLNLGYLIKVKDDDKIEVVKSDHSLDNLKKESYELWRKKDFICTALVYQSSSINAETQESNKFFVIEIEHPDLTGTYYIFVPLDKIWDPKRIKTSYVDRN